MNSQLFHPFSQGVGMDSEEFCYAFLYRPKTPTSMKIIRIGLPDFEILRKVLSQFFNI